MFAAQGRHKIQESQALSECPEMSNQHARTLIDTIKPNSSWSHPDVACRTMKAGDYSVLGLLLWTRVASPCRSSEPARREMSSTEMKILRTSRGLPKRAPRRPRLGAVSFTIAAETAKILASTCNRLKMSSTFGMGELGHARGFSALISLGPSPPYQY